MFASAAALTAGLIFSMRSNATSDHLRPSIHLDLVDHFPLHQIFQHPAQVRLVDAEHPREELTPPTGGEAFFQFLLCISAAPFNIGTHGDHPA